MAQLAAVQTINKILQTGDYGIIRSNGLDASYFHGYETQFEFINEHHSRFGNIPDIPTFLEKFENWQLFEVNETDDYLLDRLYEDYGYHKIAPFVQQLGSKVQEDSRVAYNYIIEQLQDLRPHTVCKGTDIMKAAMERYEIFANRGNEPEKTSISTGFPELDAIFGGWDMGDELVTIVARTNMGKSWILLKFLAEAWKQGRRVGLYSGEMNHVKLGYRFDALFQHFSNWGLVRGAQTDGYKEYCEGLTKVDNPFIIVQQKDFGGRPTVQKIRNFVEENGIEIMGIDQYSLMDDGRAQRGDQARTRLAHIAEDLFLLSSEYRIPILGLAQANRDGVNKDDQMQAPGLENIKESDDISHNSSKCIGMRQSNVGLIMDIIKNREGKVGDKLIWSWDIDTGTFNYMPTAGDAMPTPVRQQATTQTKNEFATAGASVVNPF